MIKVGLESNIKKVIKSFESLEKKQMPYAQSLALNRTADIVRKDITNKIDRDFKLTASWNKFNGKYGVKRTNATKKKLEVDIYFPKVRGEQHWIERHEYAASRYPMVGDEIFIPTKLFFKRYKIKTNKGVKKKLITLLSNKSKYKIFEAEVKGDRYIMQNIATPKRTTARNASRMKKVSRAMMRDAIPLFVIKSSVRIKPKLDFYKTARKSVDDNYKKEFSKALFEGMSSVK